MAKINVIDRRTGATTVVYADSVEDVLASIAKGEIGKKPKRGEKPATYAPNHFMFVTELVDWYMDQMKTWAPGEREKFSTHFHKYFEGFETMAIDQQSIDDYVAAYTADGASPQSAKRRLTVLRAAMNYAIARKRLPEYPEIKWTFRAPEPRRERVFTRSECARILWAARRIRLDKRHAKRKGHKRNPMWWFESFLWVALYTGARPEAVARLKFKHIDFIDWQIDYRTVKETRKKRSIVPIAAALKAPLMRMRRENPGAEFVHGTSKAPYPGRAAIAGAFREVMAVAGIPLGDGLHRASMYTLRHTTASLLLRRGASVWAAAGVLGVSTERIEKTYGKHMTDHLRETVNKL